MQEILSQLNILVVLTGVSVAVVQYLFTNHQTHLKDFITSLVKIDFDKDNRYDSQLEEQWESAVTECRKHTYFINPNNSILVDVSIYLIK
jgi:histidinol-phosphate/aromatic aminotransferase/cobyric acid decarboxylase-like protein